MKYKYFDCTTKNEVTQEDGSLKTVTEHYLVRAVDFTEAERLVIEQTGLIPDDIKKTKLGYEPLCSDDLEHNWYYLTAAFIEMDEKTGAEKLKKCVFAIQGTSISSVINKFCKNVNDFGDNKIVSVVEKNFILYIKQEDHEN